jgi:hypothetical protein
VDLIPNLHEDRQLPSKFSFFYQTTRRYISQNVDINGHGHWRGQISQNDLTQCIWMEYRAEKSIVLEFSRPWQQQLLCSEMWRHVFSKKIINISFESVPSTSPFYHEDGSSRFLRNVDRSLQHNTALKPWIQQSQYIDRQTDGLQNFKQIGNKMQQKSRWW